MDADDKENVVGFDVCSYVHSNMENGDQNKSKCADVSTVQEGMLQPVDLTTDKIAVVVSGQDEERWIKEPLACRENSDEEEVFFGDVTNKEIKKTKKFNSRKTAVFVPGFRRDRRLMRYTMVPPTLNTVGENEEATANVVNTGVTATIKEQSLEQDVINPTVAEIENGQCEEEVGSNPLEVQAADQETVVDSAGTAAPSVVENDTEPMENTAAAGAAAVGVVVADAVSAGGDAAGAVGVGAESPGKEVVCVTDRCCNLQVAGSDGGGPEMENLITEVINESLHEVDEEPDCSLLLPSAPNDGSSSSGPGSGGSSDDDNSEDEMSNQEIVENMMRVLDKRTAFLAALAKMRQRPDNNPNTKGKPESFERMLKESEDLKGSEVRQTLEITEITDEDELSQEQHSENDAKEDLSETAHEKACADLETDFQKLQVESKSDVDKTSQSCVHSSPRENIKSKSESTDESVVRKDLGESITQRLKLNSENESNDKSMSFLNRNNSNSVESDLSLDQVADDISELTLDSSLPRGQEILPNLTDDRAFAIDTIVARAADSKELVDILPELDVDDIIDLLAESSAADLFTPQRDAASAGVIADSNLMPRHFDNTMVVASNNRIASPSMMYPTLPEISTRIGATHTVTSVLGPISSPGAVRSEKRYRSIYATLPTDSIEIETQVVPTRNLDTDLLASFGKLDIEEESSSSQCPLDDSLLTGTQMVLPVQSDSPLTIAPKETDNLDVNLCSPEPQSPVFKGSGSSPVQNTGSPLLSTRDTTMVGRPNELCVGAKQGQHTPEASTFSPSVVFTEKNFSPLLEVHFPPSPPVEIPAGLRKCTVHASVSPKANLCSSHPASREMKRKHLSGEEAACKEVAPTSGQKHRGAPVKITPTKARVPRTPPKKVIGQPNVHKFHTAFGRNPASRSLVHKFSIHVSPKTISKAAPKTPASNSKTRAKSPVSARKLMLSKPPMSGRTPNKAQTPGSGSSGAKTPGSATRKTPSDLYTGTPAKDKPTYSSVGSAQRLSSKKSKDNSDRITPMKPLFTRPSPSGRVHGTPLRQAVTPKTPASQERTYTQLGRRAPHGKPRGTPLRVIEGEVSSSPVFTSSSPSRVTTRRRGGSAKKANHHLGDSAGRDTHGAALGEDPLYEAAQTPRTDQGEKPAVFTKGTPRYGEYEQDDADFIDAELDIYSEEPPVFDLGDLQDDLPNGSRESSPRLSMEDVLERKRQQMMNLRAEKRKIQDIISKQGSPTIKSPRANNTISYDTQPKQRFGNTQTLALSDKELEAVTQLHTLCNSQRTVKVLHKGRAMLIRQVPQSPHIPRRLSWNKDIEVEIDETDSPTDDQCGSPSSPEPASPPKPILSKKDARFVYPFDDESPSPVVVFRSRSGAERPRSPRSTATRSPRID